MGIDRILEKFRLPCAWLPFDPKKALDWMLHGFYTSRAEETTRMCLESCFQFQESGSAYAQRPAISSTLVLAVAASA